MLVRYTPISHDESSTTGYFFELLVIGPSATCTSNLKEGERFEIVAVAGIRISVKGKILRVPHTEIWRSLKVSEYPLRGHRSSLGLLIAR